VAVDGHGNLFITDYGNERIRRVWGVAATSGVSLTGPAAIAREADCADGANTPVLLDVGGTVPSGAELLVRDVTPGETERELYRHAAAAGTAGFTATFPIGTSTVIAEVLEGAKVLASFTFTVQVDDTTAPELDGVADATIELAGVHTPIHVSLFGITVSDAGDPHPTLTLAPSELPLGKTTVTVTAADASGNTTSDTFDVTVVDTAPPAFTVEPADVAKDCTDGSGGATVVFDVQAVDLSGPVTIECTDEDGAAVDPAGTRFAVGDHTVACAAADGSGNKAYHSFRVSIADVSAPVMVLPDDIVTGTDDGRCTAKVTFSVTASDDCSDVTIKTAVDGVAVASGDAFPCGATIVTCTATDAAGNKATGSFQILVRDDEAPVITAPANVTLVTDCAGRPLAVSPATLGATAKDNCDPNPTLSCSPSTLSPGTTSVTVRAADADGNVSTKPVSVKVLKGAFSAVVMKPLEGTIDNLIKPGQVVPVQVKVTCDGAIVSTATVTIDDVLRIDGAGTPIEQTIDDAGSSNDGGTALRWADGVYKHNLSTKGWPTASGARFKVIVRVAKEGHADALVSVILRNR
jgi:hypothetical protein